MTGVATHFASDSVEIHYELLPAGPLATAKPEQSSELIVLLHGLSQQCHYWGPVVERLRQETSAQIVVVDQRGHGDSDCDGQEDFSIQRCATDVVELIETTGATTCTVVGHSWGASVALRAAALLGTQCAAVVLVDGGLFGPAMLGDRTEVREQLRPPALGIPMDDIFTMMREGDLGPYWSPQIERALSPTFAIDNAGLARTRLGMERHMAVLESMFDYVAEVDLAVIAQSGETSVWAVMCESTYSGDDEGGWVSARQQAFGHVSEILPDARVLRWQGAIHDVPLQWPALVSGLISSAADEAWFARKERP